MATKAPVLHPLVSRAIPPVAAGLLAVALALPSRAAAQQGDVFASGGQPFIVQSVTPFGNGDCDVKLKNPRTGYVHSLTVPCDIAQEYQPDEEVFEVTIQAADGSADILAPRPLPLPQTVPGKDGTLTFDAALEGALDVIRREAAADPKSPINRLLQDLVNIPVTVHPRPATDTSNSTAPSPPGQPVTSYWSPTDQGHYADGADKIPAATLLHELTHAWEYYHGYDDGELAAVRAENWLIWRLHGTQRTQYDGQTLPADQVIWPQAASASPE